MVPYWYSLPGEVMEPSSVEVLKKRVDMALCDVVLSGHKHGLVAENVVGGFSDLNVTVLPFLLCPDLGLWVPQTSEPFLH